MHRADANPIALRAIRSILKAAHDCTVPLGDGAEATVTSGWPARESSRPSRTRTG